MLAETALVAIADAVLGYLAREEAAALVPPARIRAWLGRDPARLACQLALTRALSRFGRAYPEWADSLFDEHFLKTAAAPVLARALRPSDSASATDLADAWGAQLAVAPGDPVLESLRPAAASFLDWWQAELAAQPEFRSLFESRSERSIVQSTARTAEAIDELREEFARTALRFRHPNLDEYVDWPSVHRVRTANRAFVGRDWVFAQLEAFAHRYSCGYLRIVAAAGLGKTALATVVAQRYRAPAFFIDAAAGRTRPEQCLKHLAAQLIDRYELPRQGMPTSAVLDSGFLSKLLDQAAQREHPVWLVIDGLDEAAGLTGDANPMLLPRQLPAGAFVVLTHRPGDYALSLEPGVGQHEVEIRNDDPRHMNDIRGLLRRSAAVTDFQKTSRNATVPRLAPESVVERLADASEGNFMYLAFFLTELERTAISFDFSDLPQGLRGYYEHMWRGMRQAADRDWELWNRLLRPVIERLAVAGEPVSASWLADHTQCPLVEVTECALDRWERFLVRYGPPGERTWCVIHQSFRDYLSDTLNLAGVHGATADYYLAARAGTGAPVSDRWGMHGGYAMRQLASHLRAAGALATLFELVDAADWRAAQLSHDPSGATFVDSLMHAWAAAHEADTEAGRQGRKLPALLEEVLCALSTSEFYALSDTLPAELTVRLLTAGIWSVEQAVVAASRTPDPRRRAAVLAVITPYLHGLPLHAALVAANEIDELDARSLVLAVVATRLPCGDRISVLNDCLASAIAIKDGHARAGALSALVQHLPEEVIGKAVAAAVELDDDLARARTLAAFAPHLSGDAFEAGRAAAVAVEDPHARAVALTGFASSLSETQLRDTLTTPWRVDDSDVRVKMLSAFGPYLSNSLLNSALGGALALTNLPSRVSALAALARWLSDERRVDALEAALAAIAEMTPFDRVLALRTINPHLSEQQRERALTYALELDDALSQVNIWVALGLRPPDDVVAAAAESARTEPDGRRRAVVLASLALHLDEERRALALAESLSVALAIQDSHTRAAALAAIAPSLPDELRTRALCEGLDAVSAIDSATGRAAMLDGFMRHLPDELLPRALSAATTENSRARVGALTALVPCLPAAQRGRAVTLALSVATGISPPAARAEALTALGCHLTAEQGTPVFADAISAAVADYPGATSRMLEVLAPVVPLELVPAVLAAATTLYEGVRGGPLTALAPRLPNELLPQTITAAAAISDPLKRVGTLAAIIPHLPEEEVVSRALDLLAASGASSSTLAALVPKLSGTTRTRALAGALSAAIAIVAPDARADALIALVPQLPAEQLERVLTHALTAATAIVAPAARANALAALAPHLPSEQREHVVADALTASATIDHATTRARVVTSLAPYLSDYMFGEAVDLATAGAVDSPFGTADALDCLVRHAPSEFLVAALAAVEKIDDPRARGAALIAVVPHLHDKERTRALMAARDAYTNIGDTAERAEALASIAALLPAAERVRAVTESLSAVGSLETRWGYASARVIGVLAPSIPKELHEKALAIAKGIDHTPNVARILIALAPHLARALLDEAISTANDMSDAESRCAVLAALASRLRSDSAAARLADAFTAASVIRDPHTSRRTLAELGPRLQSVSPAAAMSIWNQALHAAATRSPEHVAGVVAALARAVARPDLT